MNEGGVVSGQPFVVAHRTAAAGDPAQGALDYPAAVVDLEANLTGELTHDGHREAEPTGSPVEAVAGVAGVGPDQADAGKTAAQGPQQPPAAVAVLNRGGGDQYDQQQPGGVSRDVPFAAVDFLASIEAAAGTRHRLRGAHGLSVHQRRRRLRVASLGGTDLLPQGVVQLGEGTVAGPAGVVRVDHLPGWEVGRQRAPYATVVGHVPDAVDDVAAGVLGWTATTPTGTTGRDQWRGERPLGVVHVRRVARPPRAGQVSARRYRLGRCIGTGDQVQTHIGPWGSSGSRCLCSYSKARFRSARHAVRDAERS